MKIGLIGLPNSGKTTIFNALTKSHVEVSAYSNAKAEPNLAIVDVGDDRVFKLSKMYCPKKTTFATLEIMDFPGMTDETSNTPTFSRDVFQSIKNMDALAIVLRNFPEDMAGESTPLKDLEQMNTELILSDMVLTERRFERIEWGNKRGKKTNETVIEERALHKIRDQLNDEKPIRDLELDRDEQKAIRGLQFLTQKPLMVILNSAEANFGKNEALLDQMRQSCEIVEFAGTFEMELSRLNDGQEIQLFMEDMGIMESARARLTRMAYKILGYISFFTVGEDEVRAWNIHSGYNAMQAAGVIHTDLMRGFIRAECFSYQHLVDLGSEKAVKESGKFRLEGKNYIVNDGDILSFRFNV